MAEWFGELTEKLLEVHWYTWLVVVALVALFVLLVVAGKNTKWNSKRIAYAAMCIAISFVLSCIRLYRMPQGGSVTLVSMLPVIAFSLACGPIQGLLVGCAYGMLQLIQDPYVIHPMQFLLDYPLGFGALALGGVAMYLPIHRRYQLLVAIVLGVFGRLFMSVLSGVVFFSEYAPEGQAPIIYSLIYNGSYMGVEGVLCLAVALIPGMYRLVDVLKGANLQAATSVA